MTGVSPEPANGQPALVDTRFDGRDGGFPAGTLPDIIGPRPLDLRLLVNPNDILPVSFLARGAKAAKAVGRIVRPVADGNHEAVGTGFLISDRLLLSNWHVLRSKMGAAGLAVQFGYERNGPRVRNGTLLDLEPDVFFLADRAFDYAVVAVASKDDKPPGDTYGSIPVTQDWGQARMGSWVNIVQHPDGEPKSVVVRENQVVGRPGDMLLYTADTRGGASGSAVMDDDWHLVALHRRGAEMTPTGVVANVGVRASSIARELRGKLTDGQVPDAALLREALGIPEPVAVLVSAGEGDADLEAAGADTEIGALREWLGRLYTIVKGQEALLHPRLEEIDPERFYAAMRDYGEDGTVYGPDALLDLYGEQPDDENRGSWAHNLWHACGGHH
jgi:V8-like Glu-specific endopeptidase